MLDKAQARNRVILALISGFIVCVVRKSFFVRFVLNELSKNGRFVSNSAKIWICGLYLFALFTANNIIIAKELYNFLHLILDGEARSIHIVYQK